VINKRVQTTLLSAGAFLALGAVSAAAQEAGIYKGDSLAQSGISASSWGSGFALESGEQVFTGAKSIKVTTHGLYQGARLILQSPLNLKASSSDPSAFLQFVYMLADKNAAGQLGPGIGSGGSLGFGAPGGGKSGGSRGQGGPGGLGGPGGDSSKMAKPKPITNLRLVLATTDNKKIEMLLGLDSARLEREDWKSLSVPVSAIPGLKDTNGQVKELMIFGDSPAVLYIGEMRVLRDETPIRADDLNDQTVAKNDSVTLTASAEAGPTPLKYEWVIKGVPSSEASSLSEVTGSYIVYGEGKTFKHQFRKSGDYTVTLTVSDMYGIKKSSTTKANIHVTL
jgi:hypothetical protein